MKCQVFGAWESFPASKLSSKDVQLFAPRFFSFGDQLFCDGELSQQLKVAKSVMKEDGFKDWFGGVSVCHSVRDFKQKVLPKVQKEHGLCEQDLKTLIHQLNLAPI